MSGRIMIDEPERLPVAEQAPEPEAPPAAVEGPPRATEPEPEVEAEATPGPAEPSAADLQKRIDQLTREKYTSRRELDELRSEYTRWQQQQIQAQRPPGTVDPVEEAKRQLRDEQVAELFTRKCNDLYRRGQEEFGADMDDAVSALKAVGWGSRPEALAILTEMPNAHRIYRELATNLDEAARIHALPLAAFAAELVDLAAKHRASGNGAAVPRSEPMISRAPEPIRSVGGTSRAVDRPLDHPQVTMAEFIRRRDREERRSRISR